MIDCFNYGPPPMGPDNNGPSSSSSTKPTATNTDAKGNVVEFVVTLQSTPPNELDVVYDHCFSPGNSFDRKVTQKINEANVAAWKETSLYVVVANNGDGTYDLQRFNFGGPGFLSQVVCISSNASFLTQGTCVVVRWTKNGTPYIKGPSSQGWQPNPTNLPPLDIPIIGGMWLQAGGYWWNSWRSKFTEQPLNIASVLTSEVETFPQSLTQGAFGIPGPWTIGYGGPAGGITVQLTLVPVDVPITITRLVFNGTDIYTSSWAGWPSYDASIRSVDFPIYAIMGYADYTAITSVEVDYNFPSITNRLTPGQAGNATALSLRACMMFPDTLTGDQICAVLLPIYQAQGNDQVLTQLPETLTSPGAGVNFYYLLSQTPVGTVQADWTNIGNFFATYYSGSFAWNFATSPGGITYNIGADAYLLYAIKDSYYYSGNLDVTYTSIDTPTNGDLITTTGYGTQDLSQVIASDGSGSYTMDDGPVEDIIAVTDLATNTDITGNATCTGSDNIISLSPDVTIGDAILFEFHGTCPTGPTPITVPGPIVDLVYVKINGVTDSSAHFVGDQVYTASVASGDLIEINWDWAKPVNYTDTFTSSGTEQSVFLLAHVPVVNTITIPGGELRIAGLTYASLVGGVSGRELRISIELPHAVDSSFTYTYDASGAILYNAIGMSIQEFDVIDNVSEVFTIPFYLPGTSTPNPVDMTPIKLFTSGSVPLGTSTRWAGDIVAWQNVHWGFGAYDPLTDSYTVITPLGIFWRNRIPGSAVNTNWTFKAWETEVTTNDKTFTGFSTVNQTVPPLISAPLPRRTAPHLGVSMVGSYALQGSWGAVGNNWLSTTGLNDYKAFSDVDFPIRFYSRDSSRNWQLAASVSPTSLVFDNAKKNPLYIPGTGLIHLDGQTFDNSIKSYANGRDNTGQRLLRNTWWPSVSDASNWVIGAGWCEMNNGFNNQPLNTQTGYTTMPLGNPDAGYSVSTWSPGGANNGHYTITCDPTYIESAFLDVAADVNYTIAHTLDYITVGIDTFLFPAATSQGPEATTGYVHIPGEAGSWFTLFTMEETDGPAKNPLLQMPGIPSLADTLPKYSSAVTGSSVFSPVYSLYGSVWNEDNGQSQKIIGDENNNFYLTLSVPYWVRIMDQAFQIKYRLINGSATSTLVPFPAGLAGFHALGYDNGLITSIVNNYPGTPQTKRNGVYQESYPYYPNFEGSAYYEYSEQYFQPGLVGDTVEYAYTQYLPNTAATISSLLPFLPGDFPGIHFGSSPIPQIYTPSGFTPTSIFECTAMGAAILDLPGDNRAVYTTNSRTILVKLNVSIPDGTIMEKWRVDVSQKTPMFPNGAHTTAVAVSNWRAVNETRPVGRYILLLRVLSEIQVDGSYVDVLALHCITNPSDTTPGSIVFTTFLPAITNPIPTGTYVGVPAYLEMQVGKKITGEEWALIFGVHNPGPSSTPVRWKVIYNIDGITAPTVAQDTSAASLNNDPNEYNSTGMASAQDLYLWTLDDGSLYTKSGA